MNSSYPKNGQFGKRELAAGKSVSEQSLMFGETAQLPGGVDPMRKYTRNYTPGDPESAGQMLPPSSLADR